MKNIVILGATGSIGTQVLDVIRHNPDRFHIVGISTNRRVDILSTQAQEFEPDRICVVDETKVPELKITQYPLTKRYPELLVGEQGLHELVSDPNVEIVVNAISGMDGIMPTITAIRHKKTVLLANKESLVSCGELLLRMTMKHGALLIPIDSEMTGILQCLEGRRPGDIEKIVIPCSGGPFRQQHQSHNSTGKSRDPSAGRAAGRAVDLTKVTKRDALNHPAWNMGEKITIDSATFMNKAFELIATSVFFNISPQNIEVVVHPEAIVHAMIQWKDGNITASLAPSDMRHAIQYALFFPEREEAALPRLDLSTLGSLTFEKPDERLAEAITIARGATQILGNMPAILNHANDRAVEQFLNDEISFAEIFPLIRKHASRHAYNAQPNLEDIIELTKCTDSSM